jgi:hypothetical protein
MAAMLVGFPQARVLEVVEDSSGLHVDLESALDDAVCFRCGQPASVAGFVVVAGDSGEIGGRATVLSWRLREWVCEKPGCDGGQWVEEIPARPGSVRRDGGQE